MLGALRATARHLGLANAAAGPVAALRTSAEPRPRIKTKSTLYAPANHMQAPTMFTLTRSPLTRNDLTSAQTDAIDAAYRSSSVQNAAAAVRFKLLKLVESSALRSEMNRAISGMDPDSVAPDAVVAILRQRATEIDDLIEDAQEDIARHNAASKARMSRLAPLTNAVNERLTKVAGERQHVTARLAALKNAATTPVDGGARYEALKALHLTDQQITALGVHQPDRDFEAQAAALRARLPALNAEIAQIEAFVADPLKRGHHLSGLGFEALIAQVYGTEVRE